MSLAIPFIFQQGRIMFLVWVEEEVLLYYKIGLFRKILSSIL